MLEELFLQRFEPNGNLEDIFQEDISREREGLGIEITGDGVSERYNILLPTGELMYDVKRDFANFISMLIGAGYLTQENIELLELNEKQIDNFISELNNRIGYYVIKNPLWGSKSIWIGDPVYSRTPEGLIEFKNFTFNPFTGGLKLPTSDLSILGEAEKRLFQYIIINPNSISSKELKTYLKQSQIRKPLSQIISSINSLFSYDLLVRDGQSYSICKIKKRIRTSDETKEKQGILKSGVAEYLPYQIGSFMEIIEFMEKESGKKLVLREPRRFGSVVLGELHHFEGKIDRMIGRIAIESDGRLMFSCAYSGEYLSDSNKYFLFDLELDPFTDQERYYRHDNTIDISFLGVSSNSFISGKSRSMNLLGILEEARVSSRLSPPETILTLLDSHTTYEGNSILASEEVGMSDASVRRYWKMFGLRSMHAHLNKDEIKRVIYAHEKTNGSLQRTAELTGFSAKTIQRHWEENNLEPVFASRYSERDIQEIIDSYELFEGVANRVHIAFGYGIEKILKVWRSQGFEIHPIGVSFKQEEIQSILSVYDEAGGSPGVAAKILGIDYRSISKHWKANGLKVNTPWLSDEEISYVLELYEKTNGHVNSAAKISGFDKNTIRKRWRKAGYSIKDFRELEKKDIHNIIKAYEKYDGNASIAAKNLGYSYYTIVDYWTNHGLEAKKQLKILTPDDEQIILEAYDDFEGVALQVAKAYNYGVDQVITTWRSNGLYIKSHGRTLTQEEINRVVELYSEVDGYVRIAADITGHGHGTVRKYWRMAGLEIKGNRLQKGELDEIAEAYSTTKGNSKIASKVLGLSPLTIEYHWGQMQLVE